MFVSDRVVFMELHKTACTHIRDILNGLLVGELRGKHNQATAELFEGQHVFFGSVRDPWEWYVSLWAYGCDRLGALYSSVTKERSAVRELDWKSNPKGALLEAFGLRKRDPAAWRSTYADVNDAAAFRAWLRMMHDAQRKGDIGVGYSSSGVSRVAGLMTYRYLKLFCTKSGALKALDRLNTLEQIRAYEQKHCFIDHFIRNESLESDLFEGLTKHRVDFDSAARTTAQGLPKTNTSSRQHGVAYYYDEETAALVAQSERLIIEKFGYQAPVALSETQPQASLQAAAVPQMLVWLPALGSVLDTMASWAELGTDSASMLLALS